MEFVQILGAALVFGSTLGGTIAGFFAYRQKTLVTVLRESNSDYKNRVDQLEEERDSLTAKIIDLQRSVTALEKEKALPLEALTKTIIKQHAYQMDSIDKLVILIHELVQFNRPSGEKK